MILLCRALDVSELHITGVTCMLLATKYEEVYPLRMSVVYEKIGHKKLSCESIRARERDILSAVNYELTGVTLLEFIDALLHGSGVIDEAQSGVSDQYRGYLRKVIIYIGKMILHDYELISNYTYMTLAAGALFVCFKIMEQLEPSFSAVRQIASVFQVVQLHHSLVYEAASKILHLAKTFEKTYANLENLKKFHEISFDDINKSFIHAQE